MLRLKREISTSTASPANHSKHRGVRCPPFPSSCPYLPFLVPPRPTPEVSPHCWRGATPSSSVQNPTFQRLVQWKLDSQRENDSAPLAAPGYCDNQWNKLIFSRLELEQRNTNSVVPPGLSLHLSHHQEMGPTKHTSKPSIVHHHQGPSLLAVAYASGGRWDASLRGEHMTIHISYTVGSSLTLSQACDTPRLQLRLATPGWMHRGAAGESLGERSV